MENIFILIGVIVLIVIVIVLIRLSTHKPYKLSDKAQAEVLKKLLEENDKIKKAKKEDSPAKNWPDN